VGNDGVGDDHLLNVEYLKNVVFSYMTSSRAVEKVSLVPVIATILNFTSNEKERAMESIRQYSGGSASVGEALSADTWSNLRRALFRT